MTEQRKKMPRSWSRVSPAKMVEIDVFRAQVEGLLRNATALSARQPVGCTAAEIATTLGASPSKVARALASLPVRAERTVVWRLEARADGASLHASCAYEPHDDLETAKKRTN